MGDIVIVDPDATIKAGDWVVSHRGLHRWRGVGGGIAGAVVARHRLI